MKLTCGHTVKDFDEVYDAAEMGTLRDGKPCLNYMTVCKKCLDKGIRQGYYLTDKEIEEYWEDE